MDFPSLKAGQLLRKLAKLGYVVTASHGGSHRKLEADGRPPLNWAFHNGVTVPPRQVKRILMMDVGLTEDEAKDLLW